MFYSHEVLTSHKHGVATIWLMATLGSKSLQRKVTRKEILKVNVPKACQTVREPEAPMALRLQSNLLYGISQVFSQQCGYVLVDAQSAQNAMRNMLSAVLQDGLNISPTKSRPEQLLLPDDPSFVPALALTGYDFDFVNLELTDSSTSQSSFFSPQTSISSQSSNAPLPEIIIPSSISQIGSHARRSLESRGLGRLGQDDVFERFEGDDDGGFLPDVNFEVDQDGNLYDFDTPHDSVAGRAGQQWDARLHGSDTSLMEQVLRDHQEARLRLERLNAQSDRELDLDFAPMHDDELLPDAQPFPARGGLEQSGLADGINNGDTLESADAAMQVHRSSRKPLPLDVRTDMSKKVLESWRKGYVANMVATHKQKMQHRAPYIAKHNVAFWTWESGIGGFGANSNDMPADHPLRAFCGNELMCGVLGAISRPLSRKRSYDGIEDSTNGEHVRRVRLRGSSAEGEVGRGALDQYANDDNYFRMGDDEMPEIGRAAPTPLPGDVPHDLSSTMPWNIGTDQRSASLMARRRSRLARQSASSTPMPGALRFGRAGSRLTSASPLIGRERQTMSALRNSSASLPSLAGFGGADDIDYDLGSRGDDIEDFRLPYPKDFRQSQASATSREALDPESFNFLQFVEDKISQLREGEGGSTTDDNVGVSFENLLPKASTSRLFATHAFLHILSLASNNLLTVSQSEDFGDIDLLLIEDPEAVDAA